MSPSKNHDQVALVSSFMKELLSFCITAQKEMCIIGQGVDNRAKTANAAAHFWRMSFLFRCCLPAFLFLNDCYQQ